MEEKEKRKRQKICAYWKTLKSSSFVPTVGSRQAAVKQLISSVVANLYSALQLTCSCLI